MPASDHINRQLFHGSNASFEVGDIVSPEHDVYGEGEVHSTNDPMYASTFGDYVYEVEPLSEPKLVQSEDDKEHWVSNTGYKVTRQVY